MAPGFSQTGLVAGPTKIPCEKNISELESANVFHMCQLYMCQNIIIIIIIQTATIHENCLPSCLCKVLSISSLIYLVDQIFQSGRQSEFPPFQPLDTFDPPGSTSQSWKKLDHSNTEKREFGYLRLRKIARLKIAEILPHHITKAKRC